MQIPNRTPRPLGFGFAKGAGFDFSSLDHSANPFRMLLAQPLVVRLLKPTRSSPAVRPSPPPVAGNRWEIGDRRDVSVCARSADVQLWCQIGGRASGLGRLTTLTADGNCSAPNAAAVLANGVLFACAPWGCCLLLPTLISLLHFAPHE